MKMPKCNLYDLIGSVKWTIGSLIVNSKRSEFKKRYELFHLRNQEIFLKENIDQVTNIINAW